MCGIAGKIFYYSAPDTHLVRQMTDALAHRGPDAYGVHQSGEAVLGHRRLAIIDLSPSGRQPMQDCSGRYWITFNGEIYNYQEIRRELEKEGARFLTNSDTEVIIEGFKFWGESVVTRLNGMFAFALWDSQEHSLFLARDRLGKKPLYYALLSNSNFVFGSELRALEQDPEIARSRTNEQALITYLHLSYVLGSQSILSGVSRLEPGWAMTVNRSGITKRVQYWDLSRHFNSKKSYSSEFEAQEELTRLLDSAVSLRLMSDVPLGAFLSGGVDSSAIVASMCRVRDAQKVLTFTASFNESSFNELPEAQRVADFLKVTHHESKIGESIARSLPKIIAASDEPFADTSLIPMYLLSAFTRKHVTVTLSGDGADEIFAGYETYSADILRHKLRWMPRGWSKLASRLYTALMPRDFGKVSLDYKIIHFLKNVEHNFARAHYGWREVFSQEELNELLRPELRDAVCDAQPWKQFAKWDEDVKDANFIDRAMYIDTKTWLVDDILVKADRMTMAHGLEGRAPFLDYRLVEFAASLPVSWKLRSGEKKYILKRSQFNRLPKNTLIRKKAGFNAPLSSWLIEELRPTLQDLISDSPLLDIVDRTALVRLIDRHQRKQSDCSFKLFTLLALNQWLQREKISSSVLLKQSSW